MSLFKSPEDRADAKTTAMFDAEPDTDRQCGHCAEDMSQDDVEADDGDGMCQSCRKFVNECKEESAVASFLDRQPSPFQHIFEKLIEGLVGKMSYQDRFPADPDEVCRAIRYTAGKTSVKLWRYNAGDDHFIHLEGVDWGSVWAADFSISTPLPVILAAIHAALETAK